MRQSLGGGRPLRSALPGTLKWIAGTPESRAAWEKQIGVVKAWVAASEAALAAGTALPPHVQPLASPYECSQYRAIWASKAAHISGVLIS
jgi:hypothetical protein